MTATPCPHPTSERWQKRALWLCCRCGRHFWGAKTRTPDRDIYGVTA